MIVLDDDDPPLKPGKFVYREVLLEISYIAGKRLQSADAILSNYQLAGSFRFPGVLADPTGQLTRLQNAVSLDFAQRRWVRARCADVRRKLEGDFQRSADTMIFPEQVLGWLFGTGKLAHLLLVAGLENPTVRRRYAAARDLLAAYGRLDEYERLPTIGGFAEITRQQADKHLSALTATFDACCAINNKTPFHFASDLGAAARPIAIDGSRALIERGDHRAALFWIAVTYARCMVVFHHDAEPSIAQPFRPGFQALLADLGITTMCAIQAGFVRVRDTLPLVWDVAEDIMRANQAIDD